ncbi:ATP-binding protein [Peribacillus sp. SCS-155]|uniref:ATP-binding protein n=1 Tax=Peribacillus sedimenti TaxID=3115297 RepID=UPI003906C501
MKVHEYVKKSLSRQVIFLMWAFLFLILTGTTILFLLQQNISKQYIKDREEIVSKRNIVRSIEEGFNQAFFDIRGFIALDNERLKDNALAQENRIKQSSMQFQDYAMDKKDRNFLNEVTLFTDYYFKETMPVVIQAFENGDREQVKQIASASATKRVSDFKQTLKAFSTGLDIQLDEKSTKLREELTRLQITFFISLVLFLLLMYVSVRIIITNVGKPLSNLAFAANEIAAGRDAVLNIHHTRKDELGALSVAFDKMITSLQDKEQDLLAQNEELIAHQDELHAQHLELEHTLDILRENEIKLSHRNALINGISNSLDKNEILDTIVVNMCKIINADKGIISLVDEDIYAAYGVSENGIKQFRENIKNGLNERLFKDKRSFSLKREQVKSEKGFHEEALYINDLYIPVKSASDEIQAILVFSRYSDGFTEKEMIEYETLSRQIAISLEKIKLYDETENNRRLNQDILNSIQEGIQLVDKDGNIVQVNQQLCEIFGCSYTTDNMSGLQWADWTQMMAAQTEQQDFIQKLQELMEQTHTGNSQAPPFVYTKTDSHRVYKVYCESLTTQNHYTGLILVHRDITKEYEVDQMKSEFVSTVSHELRTPLASVLGFTELMLNKILKPERQMKYLQTIHNEAKRLTSLINDFLDVQRMESGKQTYEKKYVDLKPIIGKIAENQAINTKLHTLEVQTHLSESIVLGDKSKIEQVITNLVSNAIKYSPDGGNITITLYENDNDIKVAIKDEGLGIPKESLKNLFQKFYRVDNSDRRTIGGTGLGLSIVDEIMKAHNGSVSVESEYGKGSTFIISFPKIPVKNHEKKQGQPHQQLSYCVMVIEDDPSLAELIGQELHDTGFDVTYNKSGTKALESMKQDPPDAIVLDIMLEAGEIDGWSIMKEMKQHDDLKNIPIFVSTALEEKEKGISLGASDYLVKPYQPSQLSKIIMQTLLSSGKQGQIMVPE